MSRLFWAGCLAFTMAVVTLGAGGMVGEAAAPPARKKGDTDGKNDRPNVARWAWKLLDSKGESTATGTFTGHTNGEIRIGKRPERIGTFTAGKNKIDATFTRGPLKGAAKLTMTERKPLTYKGELTRADKSKVTMQLVIIND